MKKLCDLYIQHAGWVGVFHCALPSLVWLGSMLVFVPFRGVYLVRLALCLAVGCPIGAYLNRYSVDMWLAKHRGDSGPAKIIDGTLNGAAVGIGTALLPALTSLISSNHPEMAKTFIIVAYIAAALVGAVIGSMVAAVGRKYL
jgi:CDP-diglyceride synthetase